MRYVREESGGSDHEGEVEGDEGVWACTARHFVDPADREVWTGDLMNVFRQTWQRP